MYYAGRYLWASDPFRSCTLLPYIQWSILPFLMFNVKLKDLEWQSKRVKCLAYGYRGWILLLHFLTFTPSYDAFLSIWNAGSSEVLPRINVRTRIPRKGYRFCNKCSHPQKCATQTARTESKRRFHTVQKPHAEASTTRTRIRTERSLGKRSGRMYFFFFHLVFNFQEQREP